MAEEGHVFVRADLGQIEPRVLAAVSADQALAAAARADDLYAPVAQQLGLDRPTAKVAVLGAMYGQTTGHGAQALRRLNAAYPVAMAYLDEADRAGRAGRDLRTYGGRRIVLAPSEPRTASRAAAYGRYARNAMVQGAAAELFKMWAVTVRARCAHLGARVVLCLHDELLVHCPREHGEDVSRVVEDGLLEAARRWAPGSGVRFISDTTIVRSWSDAKGPKAPAVPRPDRSAGALAVVQGLDGLGDAAGPGFGLLGLFHPSHPLLAVGERQAVEGRAGRLVPREGRREVGRRLHLARLGIGFEIDVDLLAGRHAGRGPVLRAQRDEEPAVHPGDRRAVGVAADAHPYRRALALSQPGDHLLRDLDPGRRLAVQFHRRAESHKAEYGTAGCPRAAA